MTELKTFEVTWEFQKYLSDRRKELKLSVRDLGKLANVSYTVIYDLEQRAILPKMETLIKLAKALKLSIGTAQGKRGLMISFTPRSNTEIKQSVSSDEKLLKLLDVSCITKSTKGTKQTASMDEQLLKLLSQKGLQTREIEEVKDFINFKLSQRKRLK